MTIANWLSSDIASGTKNAIVNITAIENTGALRNVLLTIKVPGITLTVNCEQEEAHKLFKFIPVPIEGGSVNISEFDLKYSESQILTATPNAGYRLKRINFNEINEYVDNNYVMTGDLIEYFTNGSIIEARFIRIHNISFDKPLYGKYSIGYVDDGRVLDDGESLWLNLYFNEEDTTHYTYSVEWFNTLNGANIKLGSGDLTITVTSDLHITPRVTRTPNKYTITTNVQGTGGTISGGGSHDYNSEVTLVATPNTGYTFKQWNDGNTNPTRKITVTGNATYTATFEQAPYLNLDKTELIFDANGGTQYINVSSNVEWTVS